MDTIYSFRVVSTKAGQDQGLTLGTELFVTVPFSHATVEIRINLGLVIDFTDVQHLLLSAGPAFGAEAGGQGYVAYQLTI
jgi:hypothetical protein